MNIIKIRGILSTLILIFFIIVLFTSIGLYFSPSGKIAKETSWSFLSFNKFQLEKLHTITGFIFSLLIIIHLFLNYKLFLGEIKSFKKN